MNAEIVLIAQIGEDKEITMIPIHFAVRKKIRIPFLPPEGFLLWLLLEGKYFSVKVENCTWMEPDTLQIEGKLQYNTISLADEALERFKNDKDWEITAESKDD